MLKACEGDNAGCFAAGTKLWTPDGYRAVETIREGDLVYSQDQFRPDGPIAAKPVEKVFRRLAEVQHLHLRGPNGFVVTIRTTGEHPFFAHQRGWTATKALTTEDWVLTDTGDWAKVEEVYSTGELASVYNLRVADWHTYFVGEQEWGWHAWAHNTYIGYVPPIQESIFDPLPAVPCFVRQADGGSGTTTGIFSWSGADDDGNTGTRWIVLQSNQTGLHGHVEAQAARLMAQLGITSAFLTINNPDGPCVGCRARNSPVYQALPANGLLRVEWVPFARYFDFRK